MSTLTARRLSMNLPHSVEVLLVAIGEIVRDKNNWRELTVDSRYYFSVPKGVIPSSAGWYMIVSDGNALYVGEAISLNGRLNSQNGSRDNFANPARVSDSARNYIKKFIELGVIARPQVILITEEDLRAKLNGALPAALDKVERNSIEKVISIFRSRLISSR